LAKTALAPLVSHRPTALTPSTPGKRFAFWGAAGASLVGLSVLLAFLVGAALAPPEGAVAEGPNPFPSQNQELAKSPSPKGTETPKAVPGVGEPKAGKPDAEVGKGPKKSDPIPKLPPTRGPDDGPPAKGPEKGVKGDGPPGEKADKVPKGGPPAKGEDKEPKKKPGPVGAPGGKEPSAEMVKALIQRLKGGEAADRIAAAKELGKLSKPVAPAIKALCEATLDPSEELRSEALESLEKLAPPLYPHVVTLLVDKDIFKLRRAVRAIAALETRGGSAVAVILHDLKRTTTRRGQFVGYLERDEIVARSDLAPENQAVLDFIINLAKHPDVEQDKFRPIKQDRPEVTDTLRRGHWRVYPLLVLADIGLRHPSKRKQIVPVLVAALDTKGDSLTQRVRSEAAILGLACIGPEAKAALPALKKMRLNANEAVRKLATSAVEQISRRTDAVRGGAKSGPKSWVIPIKGKDKVTYEIPFLKDGPAILWVDGEGSTDVKIRVIDSTGRVVTRGPLPPLFGWGPLDEAIVTWQPAAEETYRIEVTNPGDSANRCRLKHN
jgi:hypothetical protein